MIGMASQNSGLTFPGDQTDRDDSYEPAEVPQTDHFPLPTVPRPGISDEQ